ncbi:hypothetical protein AKJ16_DCAP05576 [Drosera capensis]
MFIGIKRIGLSLKRRKGSESRTNENSRACRELEDVDKRVEEAEEDGFNKGIESRYPESRSRADSQAAVAATRLPRLLLLLIRLRMLL